MRTLHFAAFGVALAVSLTLPTGTPGAQAAAAPPGAAARVALSAPAASTAGFATSPKKRSCGKGIYVSGKTTCKFARAAYREFRSTERKSRIFGIWDSATKHNYDLFCRGSKLVKCTSWPAETKARIVYFKDAWNGGIDCGRDTVISANRAGQCPFALTIQATWQNAGARRWVQGGGIDFPEVVNPTTGIAVPVKCREYFPVLCYTETDANPYDEFVVSIY